MVTLFTGNSIGEHLDYYIDDNFDKNNGALLKWWEWIIYIIECMYAIVNSILFITSVKFFLCFPIMGIVIAFFESDKNNMTLMLYLVYAILMLMHSLIKYIRQTNSILP